MASAGPARHTATVPHRQECELNRLAPASQVAAHRRVVSLSTGRGRTHPKPVKTHACVDVRPVPPIFQLLPEVAGLVFSPDRLGGDLPLERKTRSECSVLE